jgi:hypothetical protein
MMTGDFHGAEIARVQPAKLAAMEAIWDTQKGAPLSVFAMPDSKNEKNSFEFITIPKLGSLLAYRDPDAEIKGLKDFPRELRPPVEPTFYSFRLMVGIGMLMFLLSLVAVYLSLRGKLEETPWFLKLMIPAIGLPYIAGQLGWIVAEVGRQPWIVYGMLKTSDGLSRAVDLSQVLVSLIAFTLMYGSLGVVDIYLLTKYARKGPEPEKASGEQSAPRPGRCGMTTLQVFQIVWFVLWGVLWSVYFMLDGFVLGTGMLHNTLGRNDSEKRAMISTVGPVWNGNEVWLVTAGGATFAAFPTTYALMFSYLYTALLLLLFSLIIRGVSLEFRDKMGTPGWKKLWDAGIFIGSFGPALLFGVAFGNIFKGCPWTLQATTGTSSPC